MPLTPIHLSERTKINEKDDPVLVAEAYEARKKFILEYHAVGSKPPQDTPSSFLTEL